MISGAVRGVSRFISSMGGGRGKAEFPFVEDAPHRIAVFLFTMCSSAAVTSFARKVFLFMREGVSAPVDVFLFMRE